MATTDLLPYLVAAGASGTGAATLVLNVGANSSGVGQVWPVLPGDQVIVTGGAGSHIPTGVTDSQGHTYTAVVSNASGQATWQFQATATHGLRTDTPDTITVTWAGTTDAHRVVVMACPGLQASPLDGTPASATGTSAAPSVTSGALAGVGNGGNGELIVATICNADGGLAPVWPAGWQVIGQTHNTGSVWCTTAVANMTGTTAVTVAPTLAASVVWTMTVSAFKPATVSQKDLVGASVFASTYPGGGGRVANCGQFDTYANAGSSVTRKWGMQAGRIYYQEDRWPTDTGNGVNTPEEFGHLIDAGIFVLVTFRGNRAVGGGTATSRTSMIASVTLLKNYVASKGAGAARFMVSVWNEVGGNGASGDFGDGTQPTNGVTQPSPYGSATNPVTAAQMATNAQQHGQYYGKPLCGNAGLGGCGVPVYYSTQLFSPSAATACFPGRAYCNVHGPDMYASNWTGVHAATLDACITQAETQTPPLPVAVPEMGVSSGGTVPITGPNSFDVWIRQQIVAKLLAHINAGYHIGPTLWWTINNTGPNAVTASTPAVELTDLQFWWDSLNPPATGALQVTTATLPAGTVGTSYSTTLAASGGTAPYTWSATGLPAGLSCSTAGVISGAPTASGSFTVAVTVTDNLGAQAFNTFPLTVAASAGPSITTASLPNGTQGSAYTTTTLGVTGGTAPYTWAATGLPAGLSCSTAGVISGTPTAAGSFTVQVTVTDNISRQAVTTFPLTIAGTLTITTTTLPAGTQGVAYSTTAAVSGGTAPYSWSATGLPAGLSIAASTGVISGTPTAAGTFTVRLTVTDAGANSATGSFQLTLAPEPSTPQITTTTLTGGTRGVAYSFTLGASGGTTPYSWSATGLPAGLSIAASTGVISGTPTAAGSFTVTVTLTDAVGGTSSAQFSQSIAATTPQINTTSLPSGTQGNTYSATVSGSGGTAPYVWSVSSGALPPGLTMTGITISGTPFTPGTFTFTILLTDALGLTAQAALSITVATALAISTTSIPAGTVGVPYAAPFAASQGVPPYSWSVPAGAGTASGSSALPPGLSLSPTGLLSGTPSLAGTYTFTVLVTDSHGDRVSATFTTAVAAAAPSPYDSLIIAEQIELLGGSLPSTNPACAGAIFKLQPGFDLGAPQPTTDIVASLILDGERPFGYRASNRTVTLPIMIHAPDFNVLAAAYEVLMQAVDAQSWTLTWTRKGSALPLVLDCFRAQPTVVQWGGADQYNISPVGSLQLTFQALPYGRSDEPLQIAVASPLPGQVGQQPPVVLDNFATVSGSNWVQSTRHVYGPNSAQWDPCLPPLNDCTGRGSAPGAVYSATLAGPVSVAGLPALSVEVGLGTDFYATWHKGPALFAFTLTDISGNTIAFSRSLTVHASDDSSSPKWQRVTAAIPQGIQSFNYTQVSAYSVTVTNRKVSTLRYVKLYLDALTANPPSVQAQTAIRGSMYSVLGVAGTARAPFSAQFQQPAGTTGAPVTVILPGPAGVPQTWLCPAGVTSATIECDGGGGPGGSQAKGSNNNTGGGGGGGEYAAETAVALTALKRYTYTIGAGGQPLAGGTGPAGGTTTFTADAKTVVARGGQPGQGGVASGTGGAGGSGSTNTTHFSGGAGAAGVSGTSTGGGGGSAGSGGAGGNATGATGGAAGTGTTPGAAGGAGVTGRGDGSPGARPGAGGGGGWTGDDPEFGGAGGDGQIKITYTPTIVAFSTLIAHCPGPRAPEDLSPIVTFGDADVPNGAIEYPLSTLIPGTYAAFGGTYTVVVVASAWNSPSAARTVTLTVKQYEFAGGPSYSTSVARTFTPSTDITNGIVVLGELTLPLKDTAPDNASGLFTITLSDSNTADLFHDCLFLDTLGQTVLVNVPTAAAYVNYFIDEPSPDRDLGRVMGSAFYRSQAISVLDSTVVSGGALYLQPGDNLMLVYAVEGAPALSVTYFSRWWLDRLS